METRSPQVLHGSAMAPSQRLLLAFLSVAVVVVEGRRVHLTAENRIIGGQEIGIYQVPWQVSLQRDGSHVCGGVIISHRWVLTAAHCTYGVEPSHLKIRVGSNSKVEGGTLYQVKQVFVHKDYDATELYNDISVLMIESVIKFGPSVGKVRLPKVGATRPPVGTKLRASGYGLVENKQQNTLLRVVDVEIRDFDDCNKNFPHTDQSTQICAGNRDHNFCKGDSGGPLVMDNLLIGLVSYSNHRCTSPGDGYTDVAAFRRWIENYTGV